jgi:hypothetical protein
MGSRIDLRPEYTNRRTALKLVADFSNHWTFLNKTWGYKSARIKVPYRLGSDFWVHLNLIVQPAQSRQEFSTPPDVHLEEDDGPFHFEIRDKQLLIVAPLDQPNLWGTVHGRTTPLLYIDRSTNSRPLCNWQDGTWLDLRVWITSEADRPPTLPQYENSPKEMVSGGQFESNRRRH